MLMQPNDVTRGLYANSLISYVERSYYELRPGQTFYPAFHIRAICHQLERVAKGETRRLLILMPPRHGKSLCASVAFLAWMLGNDSSKRVINVCYGADLAEGFAYDARRLMQSDWHQATFPSFQIDPKKSSLQEIKTTAGGFRMATSKGGPLTGKGADILLIDDASKAADVASETQRENLWEWFTGTAITRLDKPKEGAVVVVAQRLHMDDLPGRLIATGEWDVLELPAIETRERRIDLGDNLEWPRSPGDILFPDVIGQEELDRLRSEMGTNKFEAQFQQSPVPAGGNIIRPEWFRTYASSMRWQDYEAVVQSWDTAAIPGESNDLSVCTTWGLLGNHIDLLDVYREQRLYPDLLRDARTLAAKWKPDLIVVEKSSTGLSLRPDLVRVGLIQARWLSPEKGKVERMVAQSTKLEQSLVRLPPSAPWKERFVGEAAAFPNGKYDDQVDSMSQALRALDMRPTELRHCSRFKG